MNTLNILNELIDILDEDIKDSNSDHLVVEPSEMKNIQPITDCKVIAILPIKHESVRTPGKNFRDMNGKPLFYYVINTLLNVEEIEQIVIDTNSPIIFEKVPILFKNSMNKIILYKRPKHLWAGEISMNKIILNVVNDLHLKADCILQTHVTNPLVKTETFSKAIQIFLNNKTEYECLFSVKTHYARFYIKDGNELNHSRFVMDRTQDLDPLYEENSCIFIFKNDTLQKYKSRIGNKTILFKMGEIESQDIDWEQDFIITEALMKYML
eukprot:490923_1